MLLGLDGFEVLAAQVVAGSGPSGEARG